MRSHESPSPAAPARVAGFRTMLLLAMMLVVSAITALGLYFAQRSLAFRVERDLEQTFQATFDAMQNGREIRQAALLERSLALGRKSRIHAALEDDALDLLYLTAQDELRDIMRRRGDPVRQGTSGGLQAQFYRFLDRHGRVISPAEPAGVGRLSPAEEAQLALPAITTNPQIGYIVWRPVEAAGGAVAEVIAMPIFSTTTGEAIGALVLGFEPFAGTTGSGGAGMINGIWLGGLLHAAESPPAGAAALAPAIERATAAPVRIELDGSTRLLFAKRLNPESLFPIAHEVALFPLADLIAQQRQLSLRVLGAGGLLLLLGLGASHLASARLSAPVEKLAVDSERSARFSADASHQLKTPVTVLRAGLEELLAREHLTPAECEQVSALIHQTYRLSTLIEDLLLLSRMDAGRLKLELAPIDLTHLIEASLDDLSALPDDLELNVETDVGRGLQILGEKRYTMIILQNLLENARKYNRRGGRIRVAARAEGDVVRLSVGNTGRPIAAAAQAHIFERFHRGAFGENVPGYGLGLNLAREVARRHQGDLRLVGSNEHWTEFEALFRAAPGMKDIGPR
jgi:signal transduction histidine kinase